MNLITKERYSDSPFVETITQGHTVSDGSTIRPAEYHWHMVLTKHSGRTHALIVGPLSRSGVASWGKDAEILWIKFKLGTFMPHLTPRNLLDSETLLPEASSKSFWLRGSALQFPDFENIDTFLARLARDQSLAFDPLVHAALSGNPDAFSLRTLRHRFLRATGLSQTNIRQMQRAQHAEALLKQGVPILDTVDAAGYFDQPHLTRALKQWIGHTPAQIVRQYRQDCHSIQDSHPRSDYNATVPETKR